MAGEALVSWTRVRAKRIDPNDRVLDKVERPEVGPLDPPLMLNAALWD